MIKVWAFDEAPKKYQKLSNNGGDEDWVAFVPDLYNDRWICWLEHLGCCSTEEHAVVGGTIVIGSHA